MSANRRVILENSSPVAINAKLFPKVVPTFSLTKNDELKKRQKLLERFNTAASKILIINRMIKRLRKIQ